MEKKEENFIVRRIVTKSLHDSRQFWSAQKDCLPSRKSKGAWANCFSFRYQGRMCSRRSCIEHEARGLTVLSTRDHDTLKMTNRDERKILWLIFLRLTFKLFQSLHLTTNFLAVLRLTVNLIETLCHNRTPARL